MMSWRAAVSRSAPLLACLGLLGIWQIGALILSTDSFPTALEAIRAIPSILGDKESLINILASLRRMAIGFSAAVLVSKSTSSPSAASMSSFVPASIPRPTGAEADARSGDGSIPTCP